MNVDIWGPSASHSQITTFIDLCYRYGISPAPKTILPAMVSGPRLSKNWSLLADLSSTDMIRQMRYSMDPSSIQPLQSATYEAVLDWLKFYSLLELALFAQVVPVDLPQPFIEAARHELNIHRTGTYVEAGFPLAAMFQLRLQGQHNLTINSGQNTRMHFGRLLRIDASVRHDPAIQALLRLSTFTKLANQDDDEIIELLSDPERFLSGIARAVEYDNHIALLMEGIWTFFDFCRELHLLLEEAGAEHSDLASGIRQYYAHVLDPIRERQEGPLMHTVTSVFNFLTRCAEQQRDHDAVHEIDNIKHIVHELTNRERWPLPENWAVILGVYEVA